MFSVYLTKISSFQLCMKRISKMYISSSWLRIPTNASEIHFLIQRSSFPKRSWSLGFHSFFLFLLRSFHVLRDLSGLDRITSGTTVCISEVAWILKIVWSIHLEKIWKLYSYLTSKTLTEEKQSIKNKLLIKTFLKF